MYKTLAWLGVLAVLGTAQLSAQYPIPQPTPEGTSITNTVTASYTDANGNTYTDATANVSVTVAFKGGVDVSSGASVTPTSPSTANEIPFRIYSVGNGTDSVGVTSATAAAGLTITGFKIGATSYASLALLNGALAGTSIAGVPVSGNPNYVDVVVVYNVAAAQGGQTLPITLTAFSRRDNTKTDASTTNVLPPISGTVTVTAVTPGPVSRLPGSYSTTFTVQNTTSSPLTFTLTPAATLAISSPTLPGGGSVLIAAGGLATITVNYVVLATEAAGATGTLNLTATSGTFTDNADTPHSIIVVKPLITLTKTAYRSDGSTVIGAGTVIPGETIIYKLAITNGGTANAANVSVTDQLPAQVTYVTHVSPVGWTVGFNGGTGVLTATNASMAPGTVTVEVTVTVK
jgi:uncharacterized repeat protein (TIGR01451 family)